MKRRGSSASRSTTKRSRREYPVRKILAENEFQFLIDWKPDERTGEPFQPTWEPKDNASRELRWEWERENRIPKQRRILAEENGRFEVEFEKRWVDEQYVERVLLNDWRLQYVLNCTSIFPRCLHLTELPPHATTVAKPWLRHRSACRTRTVRPRRKIHQASSRARTPRPRRKVHQASPRTRTPRLRRKMHQASPRTRTASWRRKTQTANPRRKMHQVSSRTRTPRPW